MSIRTTEPRNRPTTTLDAATVPPAEPSSAGLRWRRVLAGAAGQATAEYALVMLAAAGLAGLLLAWATSTDGVARLMNAVLDSLIGDVQS